MSKNLVITGASTGIGAATARAAVAAGWKVALGARTYDKLAELVEELGTENAIAVQTDVTDFDQVQKLIDATVEQYGSVEGVFANAGFGASRGFMNESVEHWREMVLTNVLGAALTIRAAMPAVIDSKGHFVLTGSIAGTRA